MLGYNLIVFDWQALCWGEGGASRGGVLVLLQVYGEEQETSQAGPRAGQGPRPREGEEENDVNSFVTDWSFSKERKNHCVKFVSENRGKIKWKKKSVVNFQLREQDSTKGNNKFMWTVVSENEAQQGGEKQILCELLC